MSAWNGYTQNKKALAEQENSLLSAVQQYVSGDVQGATTALQSLSRKAPDMDAVWYYLGLCQMAQHQLIPARESLRKAVAASPDNYWYRERLALLEFYTGDPDAAIAIYEKMREDFPKDTQVPYTLANVYMQSGHLEEAIGMMDEIDREFGRSESVSHIRYRLLMDLNRPEEALQTLVDCQEDFPSPQLQTLIADHYGLMGQDSLSIAGYREVLADQPDFLPALAGLAELYRDSGQEDAFFQLSEDIVTRSSLGDEARRMFLRDLVYNQGYFVARNIPRVDSLLQRAVAFAPEDSSIVRTAGNFYLRSDHLDRAEQMYRRILDHYPADSLAHAEYISSLLYQDKWEEASAAAGLAYERLSGQRVFLDMKNYADYSREDYPALIANAERLLSSEDVEDRVSALSTIGDIYHQMGDDKKAFAAYKKALKLNPDYAPVLNNYAYYLSVQGKQLKKAYSLARRAVEQHPDNANYVDTFAWILHLQGRDLEAKPQLKHAMLYGGKDSAVILDHYAEVLYALKEYEMARIYWDQALAKNDGELPGLKQKVEERLRAVGL